MKNLSIAILLALTASVAVESNSHAYLSECPSMGCGVTPQGLFTTTTFLPLAVVLADQLDLSSADGRDMVVAQAEETLNGTPINQSENLIHALAVENGVSDEAVARAVVSLQASGAEISNESIRNSLK